MKHKIPKIGNIDLKHKGGPRMKRKIGLLALMAVFIFGLATMASAADPTCTFDQTATTAGTSSTYIRGSAQNLSVTITNPGEGAGNNCTKCVISVSSGTITGALTFNTSDGTNNTYCNTTVSTLALEDDGSVTHTFTMTMYNESQDAIGTACTRTFVPDNTVPICTHSQSSRETYNPKQTWTITGTNASSATIKFGSNTAFTMTESSDTFTYTGHLPESTYEPVRGTTSDGLNSTTCDLNYVRIDARSTIKQVGVAIAASEGTQKAAAPTGRNTAVIVIVVGLGLWYYFKKK